MAQWIDRASLWLFTSFSALFLMMALTKNNIPLSLVSSFLLVSFLHMIITRIPNRKSMSRKRRIQIIHEKLRFWTILPEDQALAEIRSLLPGLFEYDQWSSVHLVQRFPDSGSLDADHLLSLWKSHRGEKHLRILSTCNASPETIFLIQKLKNPSIRICDSKELTNKLLPAASELSSQCSEKKRCVPRVRIAQMAQSIHPLRSGLYFIVFLLMHRLTHSVFYLISSVIFLIQLTICLFIRMRSNRLYEP